MPVKAGNFVRFLDAYVHLITSAGLDAARPEGLTTSAKITPKDATVLYVGKGCTDRSPVFVLEDR